MASHYDLKKNLKFNLIGCEYFHVQYLFKSSNLQRVFEGYMFLDFYSLRFLHHIFYHSLSSPRTSPVSPTQLHYFFSNERKKRKGGRRKEIKKKLKRKWKRKWSHEIKWVKLLLVNFWWAWICCGECLI